MTADSDHGDRLPWSAMGIRIGFTSEQPQPAEILAAIDRMSCGERLSGHPYLDGSACTVASVLYRHRDGLYRIGLTDLGGNRRLIGLEDITGGASFVLDLGSEAISALTLSRDRSRAPASPSVRQCGAVEESR